LNPHGKAAAALRFGEAPVSKKALENMLRGKHPSSGDSLVRGAGEKHRAGYEVQLAPSKDVSVLWGLCDDEAECKRIEKVLDAANLKAFERLEHEMYTRLGVNGIERQKAAGGVAACFRHGSSRKGDPHIHYHNLIANMVVCQDGTVRTLEDSRLMEIHDLMDALFQREVAKGLRDLGYRIDEAMPVDGGKPVLTVKGIPESVRKLFSKRDEEIEAVVQKTIANGKTVSSKLHAAISRTTKTAKGAIDRDVDFKNWKKEAAKECGFKLKVGKLKKEKEPEPIVKEDIDIVNDLLKMQSVFSFDDLETAVAKVAMYDPTQDDNPDAVQERVRRILRSEQLMPLQGRTGDEVLWTTRERREAENQAIAWAKQTENDRTHARKVSVETFEKTLSDTKASIKAAAGENFKEANWQKQEASVRHLVMDSGQCCILKGVAGGGKSSTMKVAVDAFKASGMKVFGVATSNMAAKNLEAEAGAESCSIALMLTNIENGKSSLDSNSVLIVDEAGMVGSVAMSALMRECRSKGAKLILAGEKEQIQAVESGGLMARIEDGLEHIAELLDINRQRNDWHKNAVMDMRNGKAEEALQAFEDNGLIVVRDDKEEVLKAAVDGWLAARNDGVDESKLLMLAATRDEVRRLNTLTRRALQEEGVISKVNHAVTVRVNEQEGVKTKYDIREERQFAEGERIVFKKRYKELGVVNGTTGTIKELSKGINGVTSFVVELGDGKIVSFKSDKVDCFDTSYACTTHAAQGRTVERSFFVASAGGGAGGGMLDRHLSYVAISRSKGDTTIYCTTEDREDLPADMKRERLKDTTLDYQEIFTNRDELIYGDHSKQFLVAETLTQAIEWKQHRRMEELLKEHPDFIEQAEAKSGNTPLHFAVLRADSEAVEILLRHGADADRENNYGFTPRADAEKKGLTFFGDLTVAKASIAEPSPTPSAVPQPKDNVHTEPVPADSMQEAPVPVAPPIPATVNTTSVKAEAKNIVDKLTKGTLSEGRLKHFLFKNGAPRANALEALFELKNDEAMRLAIENGADCSTMLHEAFKDSDIQTIDELVSFGVSIDAKDANGDTMLHKACLYEGGSEMASMLLKRDANPDIPDKGGDTPRDFARMSEDKILKRAFGIIENAPKPEPSFAKVPKAKGLDLEM